MSTSSDERQQPSDEEQELLEYLEAAKELEAAREVEAAEFIREQDSEEDEEAGETEEGPGDEIQDAPASLIEDESARRTYWQAHAGASVSWLGAALTGCAWPPGPAAPCPR